MGFNTVCLVLNDYFHDLIKSPHAVTWALCHPPHSKDERSIEMWVHHISSVAKEHNEGVPIRRYGGGLTVLPTFHADSVQYLYAGRNSLEPMEVVKYGHVEFHRVQKEGSPSSKHRDTVTLLLPEWWRKDG